MKMMGFNQVEKFLTQNTSGASVEKAETKGVTEFKVGGKVVLSAPTSVGKINEMTVKGALRNATTDRTVRNRPGGSAIAAHA